MASTSRETHDSSVAGRRRSELLAASWDRPADVRGTGGPGGRHASVPFILAARPGMRTIPPRDRHPPRQLVEDPPDAPLVQPGPPGDLGVGQPLPLEDQDLAMAGRAFLEHPLPQLVLLGDLAGPRLRWRCGRSATAAWSSGRSCSMARWCCRRRSISRFRATFMRKARRCERSVNRQPASRNPHRTSAQTDWTMSIVSSLDRKGPLNCRRIAILRYGSYARNGPLRRRDVAAVQFLDQLVEVFDAHRRLSDQLRGSSGNPRASCRPEESTARIPLFRLVFRRTYRRAISTDAAVLSRVRENTTIGAGPVASSKPESKWSS